MAARLVDVPALAPPGSHPWPGRPARRAVEGGRCSQAGCAVALALGCASLAPSLLPRGGAVQGVVSGLGAAAGYAAGVVGSRLVRAVTGWQPSAALRARLWRVLLGVGVPAAALSLWLGHRWQRELHVLVGEPPPGALSVLVVLLVAPTVAGLLLGLGRGLRRLGAALAARVPARSARPLAVLLGLAVVVSVTGGLLRTALVAVLDAGYAVADRGSGQGVRPAAAERSGSPASLVEWDALGRQGRDFVAGGPTVADLEAFAGGPARQPVRVYVGLGSAGGAQDRAALAVAELERTRAFDRAVVLVVTPSGSGPVDPASAAAVELLHHGDSAVVAVQPSRLPGWLSLVLDPGAAQVAGRALFDRVYAAWSARPAGERPLLLVTGTGPGAAGSQAAFAGLADLGYRADGAVWAGPAAADDLHRRLVGWRVGRTPQRLPVYDCGRTVRFAAAPADLDGPACPWGRPRVVYLQHGSDPLVAWDPALALRRPDWLAEPRAADVSPHLRWVPLLTLWQLTADLPSAGRAPAGHGHHYREELADAWAAVAAPAGWTASDTRRLRDVLAGLP